MGALALIAAAALAGQPIEPETTNQPDWAEQPRASAVFMAFPPEARRLRVSGRATIRCTVQLDGRLNDCVVISEAPLGWGFGQAALKMSKAFRMKPRMDDGAPVSDASVTVPVGFVLQDGVVKVECGLTPGGLTRDCRSISEDPPGRGMGKAVVEYAEGRKPDRKASWSRDGKVTWGFSAPIPVADCAPDETKFPCRGPSRERTN